MERFEGQIDRAVAANPEIQELVQRLESQQEDELELPQDVPSGDTLAQDFQRFLRQRGDNPDKGLIAHAEVAPTGRPPPSEASTFAACLATILELDHGDVPVPEPDEELPGWRTTRWLGGLGLGLVPVADAPKASPGPAPGSAWPAREASGRAPW